MLMAQGLPLPGKVVANGWLMVGGEKMSKSNLTGIKPQDLTAHFGVDAYRWYFLRAIAYGSDGSFSWEDFSARYTSELANDYGNLASRVAAMVGKYFGGVLLSGHGQQTPSWPCGRGWRRPSRPPTGRSARSWTSRLSILAVFDFVKQVNGYITEQEPWKVAKDTTPEGQARLAAVLYTAAESLRGVAVLLNPVMPETSQRLWKSLGAEESLGALADQRVQDAGTWGAPARGRDGDEGRGAVPAPGGEGG